MKIKKDLSRVKRNKNKWISLFYKMMKWETQIACIVLKIPEAILSTKHTDVNQENKSKSSHLILLLVLIIIESMSQMGQA